MPAQLANLESVDRAAVEKLAAAGIVSTADLLDSVAGRSDRAALVAEAGMEQVAFDRLLAMADLMRVSGISEPHAQLLAVLDTPTAGALAAREAPILIKQMRRKNVELLLARSMPPESTVARWIEDARKLPPIADA